MRKHTIILVLMVAACQSPNSNVVAGDGGVDSGRGDLSHQDGDGGASDLSAPPDLAARPDLSPPRDAAPDGMPDSGSCDSAPVCAAACGANRQCTVSSSCQATCGSCTTGYELVMGSCELVTTHNSCATRGDCMEAAGSYCLQLATSDDPLCRAAPCPPGQSWNRVTGLCMQCACGGNEWPVTDEIGACFCQPGPGQFYDRTGGGAIKSCDQDGDGWLNKEVGDEIQRATHSMAGGGVADYTVLLNLPCTLEVFTGVDLINEWGQTLPLSIDKIMPAPAPSTVPLYEDPTNDDGTNPTLAAAHLSATSANSLTKVCLTPGAPGSADLDANQRDDYTDSQTTAPVNPWLKSYPYQRLASFVELYEVRFRAAGSLASVVACPGCPAVPMSGTTGRLEIRERSRCDAGFPFTYAESDSRWRGCTRRRDRNFSTSNQLGYDFAAYDCLDTPSGACSYAWTAPWPAGSFSAPPPPLASPPTGQIPPHGECDSNLATGDLWRGMTQYSQFRCAMVADTLANNQVLAADVWALPPSPSPTRPSQATWEAESCTRPTESPAGTPPSTATLAHFACSAGDGSPGQGQVAWFARRYQDYPNPSTDPSSYPGGCIDEGVEWSALCANSSTLIIGDPGGFGSVLCGPACPYDATGRANEVFYGDISGGTLWMCTRPASAGFRNGTTQYSGGGWTLDGEMTLGLPPARLTNCPGPGCFTIE